MDRLTKAQMEFMNGYVPATIDDVYNYQEGGVAQGDQGNDEMMKMIQTYAQMIAQQSGEDPNKVYQELMGQLQQMKPEQQQAAIQEIVKQVQTVSQQPAMQMGGDPSQMQQAPQQQGGDAEQLIQQVQQMLQQGAQPQEVIAQLLQLQIDPQMIVEIFVQLGMPQEQVVPVVQEVMQQMGSGQEQEVPQEQMQEQGMEEPMQEAPQQGMEHGGITKYPYGGMYDKKYYGNFLPKDALNNAMTDVNMLALPAAALAATNIKPLKQIAGIAGLASGLAGAFQGYRGLAKGAVFGKKDSASTPDSPVTNPDSSITNAQATNIYNKYGKSQGDPWANKMMDKYMNPNQDPWAKEMSKKYLKNGSIPNNPVTNTQANLPPNTSNPNWMSATPSSTAPNVPQKSFKDWQITGDVVRNQGKSQEQLQSEYDVYLKQGYKYGGNLPKAQYGRYKVKDEREEAFTTVDNTRVVKPKFTSLKKLSVKNKTDKEIAAEREAKIKLSVAAQDEDIIGNPNWRDVMARETSAIPEKLRFSLEPNAVDDFMFNPVQMVASMATNLGQAPLEAEQLNSYLPYFTSIGMPLLTGALAGIGATNSKQFLNNLINPAAGINLKKLPNLFKNKKVINDNYKLVDWDDLTVDETWAHMREGIDRKNPMRDELRELERATEDGEAWKYADLGESIKDAKAKAHDFFQNAEAKSIIDRLKNRLDADPNTKFVYYGSKDAAGGKMKDLQDFSNMSEGNQAFTFNSASDGIKGSKNTLHEINLDKYFKKDQYKNLDDILEAGKGEASEWMDKYMKEYKPEWNNLSNNKYGGLAKAQFGIPAGFDFSDPFGFKNNRFGQTANYEDTRGYTNGQPIRNRSTSAYSTPGFAEGMGVGQEGYSGVNNSMNTNTFPKPPMVYEEPQAPDLTGLYPQLSKRQQRKQNEADLAYNRKQSDAIIEDTTDNNTYKLKKSVLNEGKVNKKTANNVSGRQMANNALLGLSIFNDSLGESGPKALSKAQVNQQREANMLYNPINTTGVYTSNVQGGGNDYIPNRYTAIQDYGTQGNIARAGGQMNFAAGGQYKVSHEQLLQLLRDGAEIEFL